MGPNRSNSTRRTKHHPNYKPKRRMDTPSGLSTLGACPRRYGHFVDISTGLVERVGEPSTSSCDGWFRWLRWRRNPVDARRATPPPSIPDRWVTNPRAWPRWLVSNGLCGVGGDCAAIVLAVAAVVDVVMDWVVDVSGSGLVRRCGNCCPAGSSDHAGAISHAPAARRSPSTPSRARLTAAAASLQSVHRGGEK